jgi:uncharacterized protein with HEPN domain/predicted nucleotidyltransferase
MPVEKLPVQARTRVVRSPARRRSLARFINILQEHLPELTAKYHVKSLGVFGSYVRHEEKPRSDLDVLVEFAPENTLTDKPELREALSKLLGVKVDVVQKEGLPYYIGKRVLREVIWLQKDGVALPANLPRRKHNPTNGKRNGANMEPKREYLDYIQDMLDAMAKVQRIVAGITMDEMIADYEKDWAVRYGLQVIGEAANRIPRDVQTRYAHIPWKDIIGMRNAMAHGYDRMLYTKVWATIQDAIPRDQPLVAQMLQDEKKRRRVDADNTQNQEPTE